MKIFISWLSFYLIILLILASSVFAYDQRAFMVVFTGLPEHTTPEGQTFKVSFTSDVELYEFSRMQCSKYHGAFFKRDAIVKKLYYYEAFGSCFTWNRGIDEID